MWSSGGPHRYLGQVWAAHLWGEAPPNRFCPRPAQLPSDVLLITAGGSLCGPSHPSCQEQLGARPRLVFGFSQGQVVRDLAGEGSLAGEVGGGGGPRPQPGSPFLCSPNPSAAPSTGNTPTHSHQVVGREVRNSVRALSLILMCPFPCNILGLATMQTPG